MFKCGVRVTVWVTSKATIRAYVCFRARLSAEARAYVTIWVAVLSDVMVMFTVGFMDRVMYSVRFKAGARVKLGIRLGLSLLLEL